MLSLNLNEQAALQLVFSFIDTKSLLSAAADGFALQDTTQSQDAVDLLSKTITAYLK